MGWNLNQSLSSYANGFNAPTQAWKDYMKTKGYGTDLGYGTAEHGVIKNYSENEGILDDLVKAGVLTRGAYLGGSNGKVEACLLTPKWEKIASAKPN